MAYLTLSNSTFKDADALAENLGKLPGEISRVIALSLVREGKQFTKDFRAELKSRFKIPRSKAGNTWKWFVDGVGAKQIEGLRLRSWTGWAAAPVYEDGGTIRSAHGGAMAVPINPQAFTSDGRIKKRWRDPRNFPNLVLIKTKRGFEMLVQQIVALDNVKRKKVIKGLGIENASQIQGAAMIPYFLLIQATSRAATLNFQGDFRTHTDRYIAGAGQDALNGYVTEAKLVDPGGVTAPPGGGEGGVP